MEGDSVAKDRWVGKILCRRDIPIHGATAIEIQFAKSIQILFPLFNEVRRHHHDDRAFRASDGDAISNGQRDEGLAHTDFVRQNDARSSPEALQKVVNLTALTLLIRTRDAVVQPLTQDQVRGRCVDVAHARPRDTTRSQNCHRSLEMRSRYTPTC